jgi:hypothetical protein
MPRLSRPSTICGNRRRGVFVIHCDAHNFRAGQSQGRDLFNRAGNVGRVGVGHGLDDDRNLPADANVADLDRGCFLR